MIFAPHFKKGLYQKNELSCQEFVKYPEKR